MPQKYQVKCHKNTTLFTDPSIAIAAMGVDATGGQMAYTRPDEVKVIPLACLKD